MSANTNVHEQAMALVLERMMADGRAEALFGEGPGRALDSYRRFSTNRIKPSTLVEIPLLGEPSYDVLVGLYHPGLAPGDAIADTSQASAQAAMDWAARWRGATSLDLLFELDADGGELQRPGIHCRVNGQLDAADGFYDAIGEAWRAPLYREVARRTPEGWRCKYAAVFPGRASQVTRIELELKGEARDRAAGNPSHLRDCFDAMGFSAYDQTMLETMAGLVEQLPSHTLQFDILADGTLGDTFSLASYFEGEGVRTRHAFARDGSATKLCAVYERLGIADGRWRLIEGALLSTKSTAITGRGIKSVISLSLPCCAKVKWRAARPLPGKFYLTAAVL